MPNIKIIFLNDSPQSGKTTICLLLASYLSKSGIPLAIFDCDPKHPLYKKGEKERENDPLKLELKFPIISIPTLTDSSLYYILKEISRNDGYYIFDLPASLPMSEYLRLVAEADVIISPFIFTPESLHNTAKLVLSLSKIKGGLQTGKNIKPHFNHIIIPNMLSPERVDPEMTDYWENKKYAFTKITEVAPSIGWHDNLFESQSCILPRTDIIDLCKDTLDFIQDGLPKIEISNYEYDE